MQPRSSTSERTHKQRGRVEGSTIKSPLTVTSIIPTVAVFMQQFSTLYVILIHRTCVYGYVGVGI